MILLNLFPANKLKILGKKFKQIEHIVASLHQGMLLSTLKILMKPLTILGNKRSRKN